MMPKLPPLISEAAFLRASDRYESKDYFRGMEIVACPSCGQPAAHESTLRTVDGETVTEITIRCLHGCGKKKQPFNSLVRWCPCGCQQPVPPNQGFASAKCSIQKQRRGKKFRRKRASSLRPKRDPKHASPTPFFVGEIGVTTAPSPPPSAPILSIASCSPPPSEVIVECHCGCGKRLQGGSKYANSDCRTRSRVWQDEIREARQLLSKLPIGEQKKMLDDVLREAKMALRQVNSRNRWSSSMATPASSQTKGSMTSVPAASAGSARISKTSRAAAAGLLGIVCKLEPSHEQFCNLMFMQIRLGLTI